MRKPLTEVLCDNVISTLEGIDITDIYPEFAFKVELDGDLDKPEHGKIIVQESSPKVETSSTVNADLRKQEYLIVAFVLPPEGDTLKPIQYARVFGAAIESALLSDLTRGGYAGNTTITDVDYMDGEIFGVIITAEVSYQYPCGQPFVEVAE